MHPTGTGWHLVARASRRALLTHALAGLLLAAAIVLAGDEIEHHIRAIEAWLTTLGPWGVAAFMVLFILATSLLVPDTVLSIAAGALFGLALGIVTVVAGSLLAAILQYALSRRLLREQIPRMLAARPSLAGIRRAVLNSGVRLQALLRLTPLNPATISYILGAAGVRFRGFLLASLALIPNLVLEVYFGFAGKHVARIAGRSTHALHAHDLAVIGGLLVTIVVMVLLARTAGRAVAGAVSAATPPAAAAAS